MGIRPGSKDNTDLVQTYIGTAYDTVKFVSDNMESLLYLEAIFPELETALSGYKPGEPLYVYINEVVNIPNYWDMLQAYYADRDEILAIYGKLAEIEGVYGSLTEIVAIAPHVVSIVLVADNLANILAVQSNETNINTVASNTSNINNVSDNMDSIDLITENPELLSDLGEAITSINDDMQAVSDMKDSVDTSESNVNTLASQVSADKELVNTAKTTAVDAATTATTGATIATEQAVIATTKANEAQGIADNLPTVFVETLSGEVVDNTDPKNPVIEVNTQVPNMSSSVLANWTTALSVVADQLVVTNGYFNYTNGLTEKGYALSSRTVTRSYDATGVADGFKWLIEYADGTSEFVDEEPTYTGSATGISFNSADGKWYRDDVLMAVAPSFVPVPAFIAGGKVQYLGDEEIAQNYVDTLYTKELITPKVTADSYEWGNEGIPYDDPDAIGANPEATLYPDGTIVGSTENGSYVKHPNGELECRAKGATYETDSAVGNIYRNSAVSPLLFPVEFIIKPLVSPSEDSTGRGWCVPLTITTTDVTMIVFSASLAHGTVIGYTAKGRWK